MNPKTVTRIPRRQPDQAGMQPTGDHLATTSDPRGSEHRLAAISERWTQDRPQREKAIRAASSGDLSIANPAENLTARQDRLAQRKLSLEGIVDTDDSLWLGFFGGGMTAGRAVGRLVAVRNPQPPRPIGTSCLVADTLILTNNHVCPTNAIATELAVEFNYQFRDNGGEQRPDRRMLRPDLFFLTNLELDFTLVAVAPTTKGRSAGETYGYLRMIRQTGKAVLAEHLNVIHHPGGDRKRISIRNNMMVAEDDLWIRYQGDTRGGSSGAPVFNDQWEMVALHHGGIRKTDRQGHPLTTGGTTWTPALGDDALNYTANEGARVSRIVARIRQANLTPQQRQLAQPLFDEEPPP